MKEKYDELYNALKEKNLVSLYHDRVMFYDEGFGEIQFWELEEDSEYLVLENKGVMIYFDKWELNNKALYVYKNDTMIGSFKLPGPSKIISNHNHFYADEFAVTMSEFLDAGVAEKGDWASRDYDEVVGLLKKNVENLKDKEKVQRSCVDIANYAMMAYYLNRG